MFDILPWYGVGFLWFLVCGTVIATLLGQRRIRPVWMFLPVLPLLLYVLFLTVHTLLAWWG